MSLLYGCVVKVYGGEEVGDLVSKKIGESEFDEYSQADFDSIKKMLFEDHEGEVASLIVYAPNWWNTREYIAFHYTSDDDKLKNNLRHQVFAAYFDPRVSSAFNAMMTNVDTTKVDVCDITPKLNFPFLAENILKQYPSLEKQASTKAKIALNHQHGRRGHEAGPRPRGAGRVRVPRPGPDPRHDARRRHRRGGRRRGRVPGPAKDDVPRVAGKQSALRKTAYVAHVPGHKNSKGESAPWVIKDHKDDHIISSHKSKAEAKRHLQDMHAHSGSKEACAPFETPITNVAGHRGARAAGAGPQELQDRAARA